MKEAGDKRPHILGFQLYEISRAGRSATEAKDRLIIVWTGVLRAKLRVTANGYMVSFGVMKMSKISLLMIIQLYEYIKNHLMVQFKLMDCVAYELY